MKCAVCGKTPEELMEYKIAAKAEGTTPSEFVRDNEGTYDEKYDLFCCTDCYIKIGQPLGRANPKWAKLRR